MDANPTVLVDTNRSIDDVTRDVRVFATRVQNFLRTDRPGWFEIINMLAGRDKDARRENAAAADRNGAVQHDSALKACS
jgi:hypothetical protein